MNTQNAFKVLKIAATATRQQAHEAYRRMASQYHPDRAGEPMAMEKMQLVNEAWLSLKDVLKDEAKPKAKAKAKTRAKAKAKPEPAEQADNARDRAFQIMPQDNTVLCEGEFSVAELIDILYQLSGNYLAEMGDAVENIADLVKLFRAFSTGRKQKVYSLAMLDSDNNVLRIDELIGERITAGDVATHAVMYQASAVYVIQSTPAGCKVNPSHRRKLNEISSGLETLGIQCLDLVLIGHKESMSVKQACVLESVA